MSMGGGLHEAVAEVVREGCERQESLEGSQLLEELPLTHQEVQPIVWLARRSLLQPVLVLLVKIRGQRLTKRFWKNSS